MAYLIQSREVKMRLYDNGQIIAGTMHNCTWGLSDEHLDCFRRAGWKHQLGAIDGVLPARLHTEEYAECFRRVRLKLDDTNAPNTPDTADHLAPCAPCPILLFKQAIQNTERDILQVGCHVVL